MSEKHTVAIGAISWADLTVPDAAAVRAFYARVVGWEWTAFDMGGYEDFCMTEPGSRHTVAGICHARGENAGLPAQWLVYITVRDVARSVAACTEGGGELISGPRTSPQGKFCVIRDPAGAVCALFEPA